MKTKPKKKQPYVWIIECRVLDGEWFPSVMCRTRADAKKCLGRHYYERIRKYVRSTK